ncbi:MAG: TAT-variant-translocated molybdopterin oxidoreductase [Ignavibacteriales bacterium]|nr:TAT-variant-translocated molybdopterin oxidoreductase [Ignavibacteriales bacterium]
MQTRRAGSYWQSFEELYNDPEFLKVTSG